MDTGATPKETLDAFPEKVASDLSGLSIKWFQAKRHKGAIGGGPPGPPYYKIGKAVRYPRLQFLAWLDAHLIASTPEERRIKGQGTP